MRRVLALHPSNQQQLGASTCGFFPDETCWNDAGIIQNHERAWPQQPRNIAKTGVPPSVGGNIQGEQLGRGAIRHRVSRDAVRR